MPRFVDHRTATELHLCNICLVQLALEVFGLHVDFIWGKQGMMEKILIAVALMLTTLVTQGEEKKHAIIDGLLKEFGYETPADSD